MKNYKVKINMGFKTTEISIRGISQKDAEDYVSDNLNTNEFLNINATGKTTVIRSDP